MRRIPFTLATAWLGILQVQAVAETNFARGNFILPSGTDDLLDEAGIKLRVEMMCSPVATIFDEDVKAYLARYLTYGIHETEAMLGRGVVYLPMMEHYLDMNGLPQQLKYLPMVESGMLPFAVSSHGAAGLWQIMPQTGRALGLVVNSRLDERKDPNRSTEAAVKYLKRLHKRFGSWELALVAYNCGPGRLNRAIQQAGSSRYKKIKPFLPKETQRYLARYLAATYVGTYSQYHNIAPALPDPVLYSAMSARVYAAISLKKISLMTGIDMPILRRLNPGCISDYVPAHKKGIFLTLPKDAWVYYLDAIHKPVAGP
ncbi:MAG: lytic transglycosylase domain-containing protein [Saprospiraceae bacterium]|nr:lytic transglycosylase domain-containing protein [Saprospiraceae bacterium]MCF8249862.1 lytic transglycosylase domain-containing protein [Saprospiraceae bacterium]MCF8279468.1 lytic transglycosylase domain-containing protein [Bacteroidales bacterium]MCF8311704.1 lytic transglycosylase domain-containing protein [Saprospiraceae bacterium]MCF8440271.1 lytic transglycosylase domain-containing protein [Saprospiraceae bacterium]